MISVAHSIAVKKWSSGQVSVTEVAYLEDQLLYPFFFFFINNSYLPAARILLTNRVVYQKKKKLQWHYLTILSR
jgi:hypothetical protein